MMSGVTQQKHSPSIPPGTHFAGRAGVAGLRGGWRAEAKWRALIQDRKVCVHTKEVFHPRRQDGAWEGLVVWRVQVVTAFPVGGIRGVGCNCRHVDQPVAARQVNYRHQLEGLKHPRRNAVPVRVMLSGQQDLANVTDRSAVV